jgi:hypothetical protein
MELYIPYVAGSSAIAFIGKKIINYMYSDNSDILINQNLKNLNEDYFNLEEIPETIDKKEIPETIDKKEIPETIDKKIKCHFCKNLLKEINFSKKQLKKAGRSRCKICVKLS